MEINNGYKLAIKTYSDDLKEENLCDDRSSDLSDDFFDSIEIKEDPDNNIAVDTDSVTINPTEAICGENVFLNLDVYNIGGNGEEEQTNVLLRNSELNLNENYEIRSNMDDGDKESVDFSFTIPNGVEAKTYSLELLTEYDYRNGNYRDSSKTTWMVPLKVISCDSSATDNALTDTIFASLQSDAIPGQEASVDITLVNTGSKSKIFILDILGYESWADLSSFTRSVELNAGESKTIPVKFTINDDATGTESFTIQTTSDGKIQTKDVELNIQGSSEGSNGFTGLSTLGTGSTNIWILVIINVVLILLIILVAVKLSRK